MSFLMHIFFNLNVQVSFKAWKFHFVNIKGMTIFFCQNHWSALIGTGYVITSQRMKRQEAIWVWLKLLLCFVAEIDCWIKPLHFHYSHAINSLRTQSRQENENYYFLSASMDVTTSMLESNKKIIIMGGIGKRWYRIHKRWEVRMAGKWKRKDNWIGIAWQERLN